MACVMLSSFGIRACQAEMIMEAWLTGIFIESFLAGFQNPISISYNRLGSDTLWAGLGSGRGVRTAQWVAMLRGSLPTFE